MIDEGIHDGDLVVVERRDSATTGEMVVALVDDEATLKRFYPGGRARPPAAVESGHGAAAGAGGRGAGPGCRRRPDASLLGERAAGRRAGLSPDGLILVVLLSLHPFSRLSVACPRRGR